MTGKGSLTGVSSAGGRGGGPGFCLGKDYKKMHI